MKIHPLEFVKAHPVGVTIGVVVLIGVFLVIGSGDGSASTADTAATGSQSDVQAGLAMAQLSASLQASTDQTSAAKDVALAGIAAQTQATQLAAQNTDNQTQAALALGERQADSTDLVSTLAAKLQGDQITAQVQEQAATQATLNNQIQAIQNINQQNNQPHGLFGWLFG